MGFGRAKKRSRCASSDRGAHNIRHDDAPLVVLDPHAMFGSEAFELGPVGGAAPSRDAALLIHGFASTPAEMRPVAERLAKMGIHAYAPLLPGHGGTVHDLEATPWPQWYDAVAEHARTLAARHERVFGVGFSAGGALMLRLAALEPSLLSGLATLAAPVALSGFGRAYTLARGIGLDRVLRFWPKPLRDIRDPEARRSYPSLPKLSLRAVGSLAELLKDVRARLRDVTTPLFVAHSTRDHTVSSRSAKTILANVSSEKREVLWLRESFHVITVDRDKDLLLDALERFFRELSSAEPRAAAPRHTPRE